MGLQARNVAFAVLLLMLVIAPAVLASTMDEAQARGAIGIEFEGGAVLQIGGLEKDDIVLTVKRPYVAGAEFEKDYGSHEVYLQYTTLVPEGQTFKCYKRFYAIRSVLHGSLGIAPGGFGFPET